MTTSTRPWRSSAPRRWGRPSPNSSPCRPTPITWSTGCRRPTPRCSWPDRLSLRLEGGSATQRCRPAALGAVCGKRHGAAVRGPGALDRPGPAARSAALGRRSGFAGGSVALGRLGMLGRPGLAIGFGIELVGDRPVDGLADDVGMPGMAGDLGGQVPEDPADGHDEVLGHPRVARDGDLGSQADPVVLDDPTSDVDLGYRTAEHGVELVDAQLRQSGAVEQAIESEPGIHLRELVEVDEPFGLFDLLQPAV